MKGHQQQIPFVIPVDPITRMDAEAGKLYLTQA